MKNTLRTAVLLLAFASFLAVSCSKTPPKEPEYDVDPYESVAKEPTVEPKPAPPPKCESLDEACKASGDMWVEVGDGAQFQPSQDWLYAKLEGAGIAKVEDGAAAIMYKLLPAPLDPKKDYKSTAEALQSVFEAVHVTVPEKVMKKAFRKKGVVDDKGELKLNTWQLDGAKVGEDDGVVIVVTAALGDERGVVGAVALKNDKISDYLEAVQASYRTLRGAK